MGYVINPYVYVTSTPFENLYSMAFDGTDDVFAVNSLAASFQSENTFSISFWAKASYANLNPVVVISNGSNASEALLFYAYDTNTGVKDARIWYNGTSLISTGNSSLSGWNHFCFVQDGATDSKVYVNGSQAGTSTTSKTMHSTLTNFSIGGTSDFSQYFNGNVDEVALFNSALSASDVTAIYNSGVPDDLTSYSPTAWYRMGD